MEAAALNVKIMFQKNEPMADAVGNHVDAWADYYACHATVGGEGNGNMENEDAGHTVDHSAITFTVRYCRAVDAVSITGFRILFRGEAYDIVSVNHLNFKKRALKFSCRKVRR